MAVSIEPNLSHQHIDKIAQVLSEFIRPNVLEWGSGWSTVYFPQKMNIGLWVSLEADYRWANMVAGSTIDKPVIIKIFDYGVQNPRVFPYIEMREYVEFPLTIKAVIDWDLIFVDGRKRSRCLEVASKVAGENTIILLHDAERKYYHESVSKNFEEWEIEKNVDGEGKELWIIR